MLEILIEFLKGFAMVIGFILFILWIMVKGQDEKINAGYLFKTFSFVYGLKELKTNKTYDVQLYKDKIVIGIWNHIPLDCIESICLDTRKYNGIIYCLLINYRDFNGIPRKIRLETYSNPDDNGSRLREIKDYVEKKIA